MMLLKIEKFMCRLYDVVHMIAIERHTHTRLELFNLIIFESH